MKRVQLKRVHKRGASMESAWTVFASATNDGRATIAAKNCVQEIAMDMARATTMFRVNVWKVTLVWAATMPRAASMNAEKVNAHH